MEKITVFVKINQADAIKAGLDAWGLNEVAIRPSELTERQRSTLADWVSNPLHLSHNTEGDSLPQFSAPGLVEATQAQVQILLDQAADEVDEKQRRFEAEVAQSIEAILAAPMDDLISPSTLEVVSFGASKFSFVKAQADRIMADPRIQQRWADLEVRAADLREERAIVTARRQAETLAQEEKKAVAEMRRHAQLDAWIARKASPMQKNRHARGLLPDSEVVDGIRDAVFFPLDGFARYARISENEVFESYAEIYPFVEDDALFSVESPDVITDGQMEKVLAMEKAMADQPVQSDIRLHAGVLRNSIAEEDEKYAVRRLSVLLTTQFGEITLSREYALD